MLPEPIREHVTTPARILKFPTPESGAHLLYRRALVFGVPAALYAVLAWIWLARTLSCISRCVTGDLVDPLFNVWGVALSLHTVTTWPAGIGQLFYANDLYPAPNAAAYGDVYQGLLPLSWPLHFVITNPIALTNVLVYVSFVLSAYGAFLLGRLLSGSTIGGIVTGLVVGFSPLRAVHIAHLSALSTEWLVFGGVCCVLAWRTDRWRWWIATGILLFLAAITNMYYLGYLGPVICVAGLIHWRNWTRRRACGAVVAAGIVLLGAAVWSHPYSTRHVVIDWGYGWWSSTDPLSLLAPSPGRPIEGWLFPLLLSHVTDPLRPYFPGIAALALAACGLYWGRNRLQVRFWALIGVLSAIMFFGPYLEIDNQRLFPLPQFVLMMLVPHYTSLRSPDEAFLGIALALGVLAAMGIKELVARIARVRIRMAMLVLVAIVALAESIGTVPTSAAPSIPSGEQWLATQPEIHVIVELPIANAVYRDWKRETEVMYDSKAHWKDELNGAASLTPTGTQPYRDLLATYPAPAARRLLNRLGVDAVVLRLAWLPAATIRRAQPFCHVAYRDASEEICLLPHANTGLASPRHW